ncbi:MAG: phosphoribosylaminoimidazolesuccinocarboxamide synthase [Candidatus Woesearchaeota archaeon]|jgi:phosphoribosylaminoimidazole-succinocarboxamide synthase
MEIEKTNFPGKIQDDEWDYYPLNGKKVCIATDREVVSGRSVGTIPLKGYVLAALTAYFAKLDLPHPRVIITQNLPQLPISCIMLGYLTNQLNIWTQYQKGIRTVCDHTLPPGLKENQKLENPILIPVMKDHTHSKQAIYAEGLVDEDIFEKIEETTAQLFQKATEHAEKQGLVLVSATYQFDVEGNIIPGFHCLKTAVYWENNVVFQPHVIIDWLTDAGFTGNGPAPPIPNDIKKKASDEYLFLYKKLTGKALKVPKKEEELDGFLKI